uniref:NADH dehydrogenase subunit 4L n=1 Tax=Halocynthia spinosa TaxID=569430 RepID=S0DF26_HALSF|nr:NADH dehydrogenase subunit 4L [Halocynthia spinosa]CCO25775.1 NADH dehydrogenase subunit 4L [Halocynthia spinosa]
MVLMVFFFVFLVCLEMELAVVLLSLEFMFLICLFYIVGYGLIDWFGLFFLSFSACEGAIGVCFLLFFNKKQFGLYLQ